MYFFISSGLNKNLFQTSSMAITTFNSTAIGISSRICFCDLVHASKYEVCGFTTAGTSSTASEPHSFAFRNDVRIPSRLFAATVASLDDKGYFQWSMFITESIRIPAATAALFISSASRWSDVVGACTTSNPASLASLNLSATLRLPGSMSNTSPFLIGNRAADCLAPSATASEPIPAAHSATKLVLTKSRLDVRITACLSVRSVSSTSTVLSSSRGSMQQGPYHPHPLKPCHPERSEESAFSSCFLLTINYSLPTHLLQINSRLPLLLRRHLRLPRHFLPRVRRCPRHHAAHRGLHSLRRLVVEFPARDALHKQPLFLRVRLLQVRREFPRRRKSLRVLHRNQRRLPSFVSPDPQRPCVWRLRRSLRPEKPFRHVPPALGELRRAERHVHSIGIIEHHIVISEDISILRPAQPPACRRALHWMRFQNPVADIDHVDV